MPRRFFLTRDPDAISVSLDMVGFKDPYTPRRNIALGQEVLVGFEQGLQMMRRGIIPVGRKNARGRPVMETIINARSETVFDKSAFAGIAAVHRSSGRMI